MRADEALRLLLDVKKEGKKKAVTPDTPLVVCERLGMPSQEIRRGRVGDFLHARFGKPPHYLVFQAKPSLAEKEIRD